MTVDVKELPAEVVAWLDGLAPGSEVVVVRDGVRIARVTKVVARSRRQFGSAKGSIWMAPDFDEIPEGFEDYM